VDYVGCVAGSSFRCGIKHQLGLKQNEITSELKNRLFLNFKDAKMTQKFSNFKYPLNFKKSK